MGKKQDAAAALVSLIVPSVLAWGYFVCLSEPELSRFLYGASRVFLIAFPLVWVLAVDRAPFPCPRFKKDGLGAGGVTGLVIGCAALALYFLVFKGFLEVSVVQEKAVQFGFGGGNFCFFAFFLIIVNASLEEYYWRWFGFSKLKSVLRTSLAVPLSGLGFAFHHGIILVVFFGWPFGLLFGCGVFAGGVLLAYYYHAYDAIWSPWLCHALIDAALMVIGYDMLFH